jgi:putative membrane protein
MTPKKVHVAVWLLVFFGGLMWSGINPHDRFTWVLEVAPAVLGLILLGATYRRFRFCDLTYWFILIHAVILMIGGHYTYAEVPAFDWLKQALDLSRNHYDKVGHFAQGFFPAIVTREILLRTSPLKPGKWLFFIVVSICLALSAFYELIEWWVALASGEGAEAFLGTQGYEWDTQSDMALCLVGAVLSLLSLSKYHDASISRLVEPSQLSGHQ